MRSIFQEGPSKACIEYKTVNLTEDLKEYIVSIHNDIRNHVASGQETKGGLGRQPSAANMNILEWDEELATMAQRWADQCIPLNESMQHDMCKRSHRFEVGQNVLTAVMTDKDFPELAALILHWYKQVGNVIPSDIDHFSGIKRGQFMIGQYTQLVWAKTRYVGCGISIFLDVQSSSQKKKFYSHRLVCNYGPTGNMLGREVYQKGIPCSKCDWGQCDVFRTSLCLNKDIQKDPQKYKRILNHSCFSMLQGGNSTEVVYLVLRNHQLTNFHLAIKNDKKHVVFSHDEIEKKMSVRLRRSVKVTDSSQEHHNPKNFVDLLYTTRIAEHYSSILTDIDAKVLDMPEQAKVNKGSNDKGSTKPMANILVDEEIDYRNIKYKKVRGLWLDGQCKCDRFYRSSKSKMDIKLNALLLIIMIIIFS
nr:unnamed protein product [Callosobruchus chinensis]